MKRNRVFSLLKEIQETAGEIEEQFSVSRTWRGKAPFIERSLEKALKELRQLNDLFCFKPKDFHNHLKIHHRRFKDA